LCVGSDRSPDRVKSLFTSSDRGALWPRSGLAGEGAGDEGGHRGREIGRVPTGGGLAYRGEHLRAGAGGSTQSGCVKAGDGGLDARRQVPLVVVEHLRHAVPRVQGAVRRRPQLPLGLSWDKRRPLR